MMISPIEHSGIRSLYRLGPSLLLIVESIPGDNNERFSLY